MRLIITEKPSVARQFAAALKINSHDDGFIKGKSPVDKEEYIITWAVGHLIGMSYPEKYDEALSKWNLETLPFIPEKWKYEVLPQVKKQFAVVNKLLSSLKRGDIYYNAGDSAREGQYIQDLIVLMSDMKEGIEKRRIWIDSQTEAEILRGIREARPEEEYKNLTESAYVRAKEDYLVGINFSRLLTCAFGREFNASIKSDKYKPISVGRVMTCVLGMIVRKEREIRGFKEQRYTKIEADTGFKSQWRVCETSKYKNLPVLYSDNGFIDKNEACRFLMELNSSPKLTVKELNKTAVKKQAPTLFNLAELQSECSRKLKISPDKTLEAAQSLYEKKLTTYPRTDARVLSKAVADEIDKNILGLAGNLHMYEDEIAGIMKNPGYSDALKSKRYVDDSKISDHYAIIPTGEGDLRNLTDIELKVFDMITRRFLAILYRPAEFEKTEAVLMHNDKEMFTAKAEILKEKGYLSVYSGGDDDEEDNPDMEALNRIKEGDTLNAKFDVTDAKTQPPKRYTSGSIIIAMENAGNLIEDEELRKEIKGSGIGTSATRAETISKLCRLSYISLNNKTQVLSSTDLGEAVYDIADAHIPKLLEPETTAMWEKSLDEIAKGYISADKVMDKITSYVRETVNTVKARK